MMKTKFSPFGHKMFIHGHHLSSLQACQFIRPFRYLWLSTGIRSNLRVFCILQWSLGSQQHCFRLINLFLPHSHSNTHWTGTRTCETVACQGLHQGKQLLTYLVADSGLRLENKSADERLAQLLSFFPTFSLMGATFKARSVNNLFSNL